MDPTTLDDLLRAATRKERRRCVHLERSARATITAFGLHRDFAEFLDHLATTMDLPTATTPHAT